MASPKSKKKERPPKISAKDVVDYSQEKPSNATYEDLMRYAKIAFDDKDAPFPENALVSAYDTAKPYYGDKMDAELQAAAEYAARLQQQENPRVVIPPEYYDVFKKPARVFQDPDTSAYYEKTNTIYIQDPVREIEDFQKMSDKHAIFNNYLSKENAQKYAQSLIDNKSTNAFRDALEHETGHIADDYITLNTGPSLTFGQTSNTPRDSGYMARPGHLVTGLGKVQREYYAQTGKRFESPEEFENFLLDLAKQKNTEEAISGFTEEAKRTLRYQVNIAKDVNLYYDRLKKWEKGFPVLRGFQPLPPGDFDLFKKSAQLIPALAQNTQANNDLG